MAEVLRFRGWVVLCHYLSAAQAREVWLPRPVWARWAATGCVNAPLAQCLVAGMTQLSFLTSQSIDRRELPDGSTADDVLVLKWPEHGCLTKYRSTTVLYDEQGRLPAWAVETDAGFPLYECNASCSCPSSCSQRLVQHPATADVEVRDCGKAGYGLVTLSALPAGAFVVEYTGVIVSSSTEPLQGEGGHSYHVSFTESWAQRGGGVKQLTTCIEAAEAGNAARFINHSCDPNCILLPVRVNSHIPHLCVFTRQPVPAGAELTMHYGAGVETQQAAAGCTMEGQAPHRPCHCGAQACSGFLPTKLGPARVKQQAADG